MALFGLLPAVMTTGKPEESTGRADDSLVSGFGLTDVCEVLKRTGLSFDAASMLHMIM